MLIRWLWRDYLRKHKAFIFVALFFMALEGSMLGGLSYIVQPMFDEVFIAGDRDAVFWVAMAVGGLFAIRAISAFSHRVLMHGAVIRVMADMQNDLLSHLIALDSAFFATNAPGTLMERVRGDVGAANSIWQTVLSAAVRDVISLIALLGVAISVDPIWTLVAVAGVPILLGPILMLQRYVRRTSFRVREAAARLTTRLDEIFHGVNTLKLNTAEHLETQRFSDEMRFYVGKEMKSRMGQAAIPALTDVIAAIGFAGVLLYGGNQIIDGNKTVGEFMSFFTAMGLLFEPMRRVANVSGAWQAARASLERIRELFDEKPTIVSPVPATPVPGRAGDADVVFDKVVVTYGTENALQGASFVAKAGETTALVGASGAGKSTIFNTLTRLVDPNAGQIQIGGVSTRSMSLPELRSLFSVVTQDAPMFDDTLRDNIVLNTPNISDRQLEQALEAAHLTEFVAGLSRGLETRVGPRGSLLSGGQRQRVAIARAVLRNAPILLLDEATSALDAESEARVQAALEQLSSGRTTLVIAHRLSTIRRADKIVVMERGRVVDQGPHADLIGRGGVYAKLYELQFADD